MRVSQGVRIISNKTYVYHIKQVLYEYMAKWPFPNDRFI